MRTIGLLALGLAATAWLHKYEQRQTETAAGPAPTRLPRADVIDLARWRAARLANRA